MDPQAAPEIYRPPLLERKAKLEAMVRRAPDEALMWLLSEVDAALRRMEDGSYGLCETCHSPIEAEGLARDPMARFCIEHLTRSELEAHEQDVQLAAQIQEKLLPPREASYDGWEIGFRYLPAHAVSGDYCEVIDMGGADGLFFAVGDIAGKGVAASLLMTHLSAMVRSLVSMKLPLGEMMSRANRLFCESTGPAHYATLACCRADGNRVEVSNAGHCRPLCLRTGKSERLEANGFPLGLFCGAGFGVEEVFLDAGDCLALYSDGLAEARNREGEEYGEERLTRSLERHRGLPAGVAVDAVLEDLDEFLMGGRANDDLTLLIVQRK